MPSKRQLQVGRIIQEALHKVLARENLLSNRGLLSSIVKIELSPNLREARIFLSVYPSHRLEEFWDFFQELEPQMHRLLQQELQGQFARMPQFSFHLDHSMEQADRLYQILDKL